MTGGRAGAGGRGAAVAPSTSDDVRLEGNSVQTLSRREREVAALVARGRSNRQVADALVVGERTAEMHVGHILTKLGLTSRSQIAVWAVEHAPLDDEKPAGLLAG